MQHNEDYVLKVLQDVGLVTRKQIDSARAKLNGAPSVVDLLTYGSVVPTCALTVVTSLLLMTPLAFTSLRKLDAVTDAAT